jgi:hypothetical protein
MKNKHNIYIGHQPMQTKTTHVEGVEVTRNGEMFFKIENVDGMRPFFMSIVSHSDHWLFISSTGSLTAGRKNANFALFPYYTDDKITESSEHTGSKSIFLVDQGDKTYLWEPFSSRYSGVYSISRNLYKNAYGNKIVFEEINHDLGLEFSYEWNSSEQFGFVRKSQLINSGATQLHVRVLDGLQNIMPYGVPDGLQGSSSNLVDAYKKCELEAEQGLGIYALSAIISDKAEPSEALKANVVWSLGLHDPIILLSSKQLDSFRKGQVLNPEQDIKAERGAYFLSTELALDSKEKVRWTIVANVSQSISDVVQIKQSLADRDALKRAVNDDIDSGTQQLIALVGSSDGLQMTGDRRRNIRHFANTMFNIMRGGIFDHNYSIDKSDFSRYIERANHKVYFKKAEVLTALPESFDLADLQQIAQRDDDPNFRRLCIEYLPLKFSRRHGDPSRPWNKFSINLRNEDDGSKILDYQGNWRDIFQNWEALAHAYPEFIEGMIFKFLNATTFDGYNPYRVFKDGFEWETIEPDNPWSYIGYWGDHQIIYLLKFLEFIEAYYPEKLSGYFAQDLFVYANVPYRIKSYQEMLKDPKNTIDFDHQRQAKIQFKKDEIGGDGALLRDAHVFIYKVNFIEKILATVLAKVANFIPEGGIWMNTQRPEWNDANNALVGNGVSMVTLYYLRRFLKFFEGILDQSTLESVAISKELMALFTQIKATFDQHKSRLSGSISDQERKQILDGLGMAASAYRSGIYDDAFSGEKQPLAIEELKDFVVLTLSFMEHSIAANKRADKLYHAYNLMTLTEDDGVMITALPEMLEGQVSVLSSGYLSAQEGLELLDALKASALFREDQYSYVLYPNKSLPRFLLKNNIPSQVVSGSPLMTQLLADGNNDVVTRDVQGVSHFNGNFNNGNNLKKALKDLPAAYQGLVAQEANDICQVYESIFDHKSFTGRSGTFFGYEGLGSIYWHMVSKLRLAVFEVTQKAMDDQKDAKTIGRLFDHYFEVNAGIGEHKSPELYGAFPTDPYSHTPGGKGAQQPGMTGQVKEDLLCRFGELGLRVRQGLIGFDAAMLHDAEFLTQDTAFDYVDVAQAKNRLILKEGSLAFTLCQVPVIYVKAHKASIEVHFTDGKSVSFQGNVLDRSTTEKIFKRTNQVATISVMLVQH